MNRIKEDLTEICYDFIEVAKELYKNEEISYKQYVEITKLKFEYIKKNLKVMN